MEQGNDKLDWTIRYTEQVERPGLYNWAIQEIDDKGSVVSGDWLPWRWDLYFNAEAWTLVDAIEADEFREESPVKQQLSRTIHIKLRPERRTGHASPSTTFQMFGMDRLIEDFSLRIEPTHSAYKGPECTAWGSVGFTSELDFRFEYVPDQLVFILKVTPEDFELLADRISEEKIDNIAFWPGLVDGIYSEWQPGISTPAVKVLTALGEWDSNPPHSLAVPETAKYAPARLGKVGSFKLRVQKALDAGAASASGQIVPWDGVRDRMIPSAPDIHSILRELLASQKSVKVTMAFGAVVITLMALKMILG